MIEFSFEPRADDVSWSPRWRPGTTELNGSDFCLKYFKADRRLVIHGTDLSVRIAGEPVVDFALLLDYATRTLETSTEVTVEASLTQHKYSLRRDRDSVTLTTQWPQGRVSLSWDELRHLTEQAKSDAVRLITTAHPALRDNQWLRQTVGSPPIA
ncbi:hypothetical protein AB0C59_13130 [Streptomyces sp. NPDC048664]|uniref:hypothetical protein n=1 Tax=Streptomyces sp. NPDC048664 TaxID=3154505 RepID=UPI00343AAE14